MLRDSGGKKLLVPGLFSPSLSEKNVYFTRVGENMIEDSAMQLTSASRRFLLPGDGEREKKIHKSKLNCIEASARVNLSS